MPDPLTHFIDLADRGHHPAASGGAQAAAVIADALSEHYDRLDSTARRGLREWLDFADQQPGSARDMLAVQTSD